MAKNNLKMKSHLSFLLFLFGCFLPQVAFAQSKTLVLNDTTQTYQVNQYLGMLKDSSAKWTIQAVSKPASKNLFLPIVPEVYRIERDKNVKAYWLRLEIDNQTDKSEFIFWNTPRFDILEVHYWVNNRYKTERVGLKTISIWNDLFISPMTHLPLQLKKGKNIIYFRIIGDSFIHIGRGVIKAELWQAHYSYSFHSIFMLVYGLASGTLFFMFIFNAIVYRFLRDDLYFNYLQLIFIALSFNCFFGLYEVMFDPLQLPFFFRYAHIFLGLLMAITNIRFAQAFFHTSANALPIHKIFNILNYISWVSMLPMILGDMSSSAKLAYLMCAVSAFSILLFAMYMLWRGFPRASYFFFASVTYLAGGIGMIWMFNQYSISLQTWSFAMIPFGESIRSVIFSIALADRINYLKSEVAQKEQETALANQQKEFQLQRLKDRIQRDLHDNFGWLLTLLVNRLDKMVKNPKELQTENILELAELAQQIIQELRSTLWIIKEDSILLEDLEAKIRDLLWQLQPILENTEVDTLFEYPSQTQISAQQGRNLYRIVQEALHNSLKYSRATVFKVQFHIAENKTLHLKVEDNGVGFVPSTIENNMQRYGLQNMQKHAKEIGGELFIESGKNKGTRIQVEIMLR
jgi:signal transduction histidine kinase